MQSQSRKTPVTSPGLQLSPPSRHSICPSRTSPHYIPPLSSGDVTATHPQRLACRAGRCLFKGKCPCSVHTPLFLHPHQHRVLSMDPLPADSPPHRVSKSVRAKFPQIHFLENTFLSPLSDMSTVCRRQRCSRVLILGQGNPNSGLIPVWSNLTQVIWCEMQTVCAQEILICF